MIVWLMWAAVAAPLVQVDAEQLVVSREGQWTAERAVKILHQGVTYRADRASYEPTTGEIILAGNVRSSTQGVRIRCQTLYVGSGKVRAEDAEVVVVTAAGRILAQLRASSVLREGLDARFDDVDFSLCTCPDRPWSVGAERVEVAGESKRVYFSVPVFRIREVPVLMLPWWSMPLKRRASGILPPLLGYDARDGLRVRLPLFLAPASWWDLSIEPGYVEGRAPWSVTELRMRPDGATRLNARLETLHHQGIVDDQSILSLDYAMRRPELEWIHQGVFPSDSTVMGVLSTDVRARIWRLADAHHWLRLGGPPLGLVLQGWSGRRTMAGAGAESDASLGVRTILRADRDWGSAGLELALKPMPTFESRPPVPLLDASLQFGRRWVPYLGFSGSAEGRSAFFVGERAHEPVLRSSWRLEAFSLLDNGRGTKLRPRLSLRSQRLTASWTPDLANLMGVAGDVLALGLKASQSGFVHDYELLAFERSSGEEGSDRGLLVTWTGAWSRKSWSLNGRLLFDTLQLEPALLTTSYTWRPRRPSQRLTVGFLRRHIGRDLTIDPDPWLLVNKAPYSDRLTGEGVYALLWGTARTGTNRWNVSVTGAVRPLPWSLNSVRLDAGYASPCRCWGVSTFGGISGELRPGEVSATPFFGLAFNAGRVTPESLRRSAMSVAPGGLEP